MEDQRLVLLKIRDHVLDTELVQCWDVELVKHALLKHLLLARDDLSVEGGVACLQAWQVELTLCEASLQS